MNKYLRYSILTAACIALGFFAFAQSKDDPLDVLKVSPDTQKLIFENQFVRVIDDTTRAGQTQPMHHHPHGVLVYLTDGKNEVTTQDGKKSISEHKAGTAAWSEAVTHTVTNIGGSTVRTIRIDIKY